MGIFYRLQSRSLENAKILFGFLLDGLNNYQNYPAVDSFSFTELIIWDGPPINFVKNERFSIPEDFNDFFKKNDLKGKSMELRFIQEFNIDEKRIFEGKILIENHNNKSEIPDLSIKYFYDDICYSFDDLIKHRDVWLYLFDNLIRRWANDKDHKLVKQINVGVNSFPMNNIINSRFIFFADRKDFIWNILFNFPNRVRTMISDKSADLIKNDILIKHEKEIDKNYLKSFSRDIEKTKRFEPMQNEIYSKFNAIPTLGSIILKKTDRGDLTDCLASLFNELFSVYTEFFRPKDILEEILGKHIEILKQQ